MGASGFRFSTQAASITAFSILTFTGSCNDKRECVGASLWSVESCISV